MPSLAALGRRWPRRRALGPQDSTPQYGQGPSAKDPAASGVSLRRSPAPPGGSRRRPESREVSAIVVTLDALPWIERCLQSVAAHETIVVDHGSTDGTVDVVRDRFPDVRLVEQGNVGLAAGWNRGLREASGDYLLILNADAWALADAVERLVSFAETHPDAAVVAPRLRFPDGRLQRSVRGFPTLWRLATEYYFLRKLAPRSRALNSFYANGFRHDEVREVEWVMGACLLVRREAVDEVGPLDEGYFLFSEETDWCYRFREAGWKVYFVPDAEVAHVLGAGHGGRFFREQVRGHLRFLAKHHGQREAERARRLLLFALRARGIAFPGPRRNVYRDAADWLSGASVRELLQ